MSHSFYVPRASGLHALHPLTKLTAACAILLIGSVARWPHWPVALFLLVVLPLAAWGRIVRDVLRFTFIAILPFVVSIVLIQGFFYPGATHVLVSFGPLALKEEGLIFAYGTAGRILLLAGVGLTFAFSTHPSDLMLALVELGMPGALAYIVVAAIQLLPQMQAKAVAIMNAQRSRGMETEGFILVRLRALIPLVAPLVLGALVDVDERAMALEARAFSSPQHKTSFRVLRDTRGQRVARWLLLIGAILVVALEVWII